MDKLPKIGIPLIAIVVLLLILIMKTAVTIDAGSAGVLYKRFDGGVDTSTTYGEGFHIVAPWNNMVIYEVREQSVKEELPVLSVDGLLIEVEVTVQHKLIYKKLGLLHKQIGQDYYNNKVKPAINSVARSIVGKYTADELYSSKKDAIQNEIEIEARKQLSKVYIDLIFVLVEKIELPEKITSAIEDKLTKEQDLKKYEYLLQTESKEAERRKIDAEGKAEANRILSASLTDKILQEKGIEATLRLSESPNSKVIVIGSGDSGMPIILGNN